MRFHTMFVIASLSCIMPAPAWAATPRRPAAKAFVSAASPRDWRTSAEDRKNVAERKQELLRIEAKMNAVGARMDKERATHDDVAYVGDQLDFEALIKQLPDARAALAVAETQLLSDLGLVPPQRAPEPT